MQRNKKQKKIKIKGKKTINPNIHLKLLSKKRANDSFLDEQLNDPYLEGLKVHLHIKTDKAHLIQSQKTLNGLYIDLSCNQDKLEENKINLIEKDTNEKSIDNNSQKVIKLIIPIILWSSYVYKIFNFIIFIKSELYLMYLINFLTTFKL